MATELFAWGYTGWRSGCPDGYTLSATVEGEDIFAVYPTAQAADVAFCRLARRAWLRRRWRVLRGLPARDGPPRHGADRYVEFHPVRVMAGVTMVGVRALMVRRRRPRR